MKRNSIQAPSHGRAALEAVADAALETNAVKRWPLLERALDMDQFMAFMAMEVMIGHRDGYCLARNNYRVYHDLDSGKVVFFPHGMDQLFGNPAAPWQPHMSGLVAKAVMETTEGKERYRTTFASLFTNVFRLEKLKKQVDQSVDHLRLALTDKEFTNVSDEASRLKTRILLRQLALLRQLSEPERTLLVFSNGIAHLNGWVKVDAPASGQMDQSQTADQTMALHISTRSASGASWRTKVLLGRGRYRFEGRAKVAGVKPLPYGKYQGAGLRVVGSVRDSGNVVGDSDWRALGQEFEVTDEAQEAELVCELRATAGEVWFSTESLKLVQLQ